MPNFTTDELTLVLAIVALVALAALVLVVVLFRRVRALRRSYVILRGENGDKDIVSVVGRWIKRIEALARRVDGLDVAQQSQGKAARYALQRFHIVRYDAFDDMGGRLSFSAALLDDHGDGVVITSINGRTETRTYAKPVKQLGSAHNLSDEEREAIAGAVAQYDRGERPAAATSSR